MRPYIPVKEGVEGSHLGYARGDGDRIHEAPLGPLADAWIALTGWQKEEENVLHKQDEK
jgi:hypothetical protein